MQEVSQVKAKTILRKPFDEEKSVEVKKRGRPAKAMNEPEKVNPDNTKYYGSPIDKACESSVFHLNWMVKELSLLKNLPQHWTVKFHYPDAKGGAAFIDMPGNPGEEDICRMKKEVMKKAGLRYAVIPVREKEDMEMGWKEIRAQLNGE